MLVPSGYDAAAFSKNVIARWGHMSSAFMEDEGLLHVQMAPPWEIVPSSSYNRPPSAALAVKLYRLPLRA